MTFVSGEFARIDVAQSEVAQAQGNIRLTAAATRRASARAINETLRWSQGQLRRDMAKHAGVPQKAIGRRFREFRANTKQLRGQLFVGVYPLILGEGQLTRPRINRMMAAGTWLSRPFQATMPSGHTGTFVRAPGDPNRPAQNRWTKGRQRTPGSENLPIRRPWVDIMPSAETLRRVESQIPSELRRRSERLIAFEAEKALKRAQRAKR